jgi:hypothetical protein
MICRYHGISFISQIILNIGCQMSTTRTVRFDKSQSKLVFYLKKKTYVIVTDFSKLELLNSIIFVDIDIWNQIATLLLNGWFSEESDKIGRGFIKILETSQFGLSFNTIRHVFFCFGLKNFFVGFMNFWKMLVLRKKKFVKSRYWL